MSFIGSQNGRVNAPGWFLVNQEDCTRETRTIPQSLATTAANGAKFVKMGTIFPSNNSSATGIVYEDVDVTSGAMPGSVVTKGTVYKDRLAAAIDSDAVTALVALGFKFVNSAPSVTRPVSAELEEITVESAAGTAAGDTAITVSGYTPGSGESYVYKVADTAPRIIYGETPDYTWNTWDGSSDITAATNKKITVASIDANGKAVAAGSATVTAKA